MTASASTATAEQLLSQYRTVGQLIEIHEDAAKRANQIEAVSSFGGHITPHAGFSDIVFMF